jgi:hypothetical protein
MGRAAPKVFCHFSFFASLNLYSSEAWKACEIKTYKKKGVIFLWLQAASWYHNNAWFYYLVDFCLDLWYS